MDYRILGPLEVRVHGKQIPIGGGKVRALLAILLLKANETVPSDRLIDELWGDRPPETATNALHFYVSRLRTVLDPTREPGASNGVIVTRGSAYELTVGDDELDLLRFQHLVEQARRMFSAGQRDSGSQQLRVALGLWRGAPLADLASEPFAQVAIPRLEELRLAAVEEWVDMELTLGRHSRVVADLEALAAEHPYRERLRAQLMLALYRSGRQADALAVYERTRRALVDGLGIEPGPELQRLHHGILAQDAGLEAELEEEKASLDPEARAPPSVRRWHAVPLAAAALAVAVLAAAAVALFRLSGGEQRIAANSVVAINPSTNEVVRSVDVAAQPRGVVIQGAAAWIGDATDLSVARVDARTLDVERIDIPVTPDVLAAGAGKVWVGSRKPALLAIDPRRGSIEPWSTKGDAIAAHLIPGEPVVATIAAADASIWIGVDQVRTVWRAAAGTGQIEATIPNVVAKLIVPAGGAAWVLSPVGALVRIEAGAATARAIRFGGKASDVAGDTGGAWLLDYENQQLVHIDAATEEVDRAIGLEPLTAADRLAIGQGSIWVTQRELGTLLRIDQGNLTLAHRIELGHRTESVSVGAGRVWVAVGDPIDTARQ